MSLFVRVWSYLLSVLTMLAIGLPNGYWTFKYKFLRRRHHRRAIENSEDEENLENEVVVITGANRGMGKEMALAFAKRKCIVILGCRDLFKGKHVLQEIFQATGNPNLELIHLDLLDLDSVQNFALHMNTKYGKVKILVNNGSVYRNTSTNADSKGGNNSVIAANHLGPFLLTNLLLECLKNSAPSRVIMMSSTSLLFSQLSLNDFSIQRSGFGVMDVLPYANSKHCNTLFAMELATRVKYFGINTYAVCPGVVDMKMLLEYPGLSKYTIQCTKWISGSTPKDAVAEFVLPLATWKRYGKESGQMYHFAIPFERVNRKISKENELSANLWSLCAKIVQLE